MGRRGMGQRNDAGSLLASSLILGLGGGACLFMVGALSPNSLPLTAGILGAVFGGLLLLIVLQRFGRALSVDLGFLGRFGRSQRDDGIRDYEPRRAGGSRAGRADGANQPITAGEARELRLTSASTWVPARGRRASED
jgi:hypothetical protein